MKIVLTNSSAHVIFTKVRGYSLKTSEIGHWTLFLYCWNVLPKYLCLMFKTANTYLCKKSTNIYIVLYII